MSSETNLTDASQGESLQLLIGKIAAEAKKRNPEGFTLVTTPSKREVASGKPFTTQSGQQILFYTDAVNTPSPKKK